MLGTGIEQSTEISTIRSRYKISGLQGETVRSNQESIVWTLRCNNSHMRTNRSRRRIVNESYDVTRIDTTMYSHKFLGIVLSFEFLNRELT